MGAFLAAVPGILQAGGGLLQSIFGGGARRKAQKELQRMVDSYQPNASILDYYNKALSKYSANPYNSQFYQNQSNQIQKNLATGIASSQDRRSGLMNIGKAVQQANNSQAQAGAIAEQQQRQDLGLLGAATGMKAGEDRRKFDMKYNLLAQKAGQSATTENMGYKNIFGGLSNLSMILGGNDKKQTPANDPFPYGI
jgi:hypothetical protein